MGKDVLSKIRAGDVFKALERVLEAEGIEEWKVEDTRPHPSFVFEVNGWQVRFHFPCTPMTRGNTQRRCSSRLRTGIQSLYMEAGRGREIEIDKHTAADIDNGRLHMDAPAPNVGQATVDSGLIPFEFEGREVRVAGTEAEPWFVLADVCRVLEIGNPSDAARRLDADEKGVVTIDTLGGSQNVTIINESGLYSLILTSRKPAAKRFKKWVTAEVLPAIRKTGSYSAPGAPAADFSAALALVPQIVEQTIRAVLPAAVKAEVTSQQGYAIVSGITAGEVVAMAGVADRSGLRGVINAVSTSLCEIHRQRGVHVPHPRHGMSSAKMFDPAVCRDWLATGGRDFIRRRVQETRGQTAMVLRIADQREPIG